MNLPVKTFPMPSIKQSQIYAESIISTIPLPLIILDENLHVHTASDFFYKTFQVHADETMGKRIYDLGNGQWDIPDLRKLLEKILPERREFDGYIVSHTFQHIGKRVMLLNARRIMEPRQPPYILLGIKDITRRTQIEDIVAGQKRAMEQAVNGAPLHDVLETIVHTMEMQASNKIIASILLLEEETNRLRHGAAPSLPQEYNDAVDGLLIGPETGCCGSAAHFRKEVIVEDIATDPLWKDFKELALKFGLRACWSTPIISSTGRLLGTFALYYQEITAPSIDNREVVGLLAHTAAVVIERQLENTERTEAERALKEAHNQLRLAQSVGGIGVFSYNLTTDILNITPEFCNVFGLPQTQEILAPEVEKLVLEEDKNIRSTAEARADGSAPLIVRYRIHRASDGELRWIARRAEFIRDEAGRPAHMIGVVQDVTENALSEQKLRESQQHFRDMADSINQMIWVTRPDGYHEYYNKRWYEYTGVPAGSTDGEEWNGMFHPEDQERARKRWHYSLETGESYEIEYRLRRADGVYRWTLGRAEPVRDENGKIVKWYGTCTDIQDLVDARQNAEQANSAKSEFLANMSHEIRTPMNAIIGLSNILASSEPLTEKQMGFIKTLKTSADTLLSLINDLLDISKIESGSVEIESIPFNLSNIIHDAHSMMILRAREKGLRFSVDCDAVKNFTYLGDPTRLRQILLNLISNAIKFTDEGGVLITAMFQPEKSGHNVSISIDDTGIGIAQEKLETIFEKFTQADNSINRKYGGTGLGLTITRTLAQAMDGTIAVVSEMGKGSTFTLKISLPLSDQNVTSGRPFSMSDILSRPSKKSRILLVEDYGPNLLVAGAFLDEFGFDYEEATSGKEAFEKIKSGTYDAVLMDVQMHEMNGLDATRMIRQHEDAQGLAPVPIIGMTAHALAGDREKCLHAGMDDYLSKPFNPAELEAKLKKAISSAKKVEI